MPSETLEIAAATDQLTPGPSTDSQTSQPEESESTVETETPVVQVAVDGQHHLIMRFGHEAWVEVYDNQGNKLYWNLVRSGRELDLRGFRSTESVDRQNG